MTTPRRLADRITALATSVDLSGFGPHFAPLMFYLNENLWPTITLMASLAAILLAVLVGGTARGRNVTANIGLAFRRDVTLARPATAVRVSLSGTDWQLVARNSRLLRGADL